MRIFFWLFQVLTFIIAFPVYSSYAGYEPSPNAINTRHNPMFAEVSLAGRYAISSVIGKNEDSFHAKQQGKEFSLTNPVHNYDVHIGTQGVELIKGEHRTGLRFMAFGYGDTLVSPKTNQPTVANNRITLDRKGVSEWYVNGPYGLQQGFTLNVPPVGARGQEPLSVILEFFGDLTPVLDRNSQQLSLLAAHGQSVLRYGGLRVFDSEGKECTARFKLDGQQLSIEVEEDEASYPLTIDPVFQSAKLTTDDSTGIVSDIFFGSSVAIDGDVMVVGAPRYDTNGKERSGAAYIFLRQADGKGEWEQHYELRRNAPGAGDAFGQAVAISGDIVVIGAPSADGKADDNEGAAYVYVKPADGWSSFYVATAILTASNGAYGDLFGNAVAVDGDNILVGAKNQNHTFGQSDGTGMVYVFVKPGSGWTTTEEDSQLTASDGVASDNFGSAVALDGSIAAIGASQRLSGNGAVYVFDTTAWSQQAKLTANDGSAGDQLGVSVDVSGDVVVAGASAASGKGAAYVFTKPVTGWSGNISQSTKLASADSVTGDLFGVSVAISGDHIVVGDWHHTVGGNVFQGKGYLYSKDVWGTYSFVNAPTATFVASDGDGSDRFGCAAAIDGSTVVFGAYSQGSGSQGAAYAYQEPNGGWTGERSDDVKIAAVGTTPFPYFGQAVATDGNVVVVGAPYWPSGGNLYQGAAYLFEKNSGDWSDMTQGVKLLASDGAAGDRFGFSVAVSGDTVVVGAPDHKYLTQDRAGQLYIYSRPVNGWGNSGSQLYQTTTLHAGDASPSAELGISVAIVDNLIVAGASGADGRAANNEGAAYIFEKGVMNWPSGHTAKLYADDGLIQDNFGTSLALSQDRIVVVGAPNTQGAGAAYVFKEPLGGWGSGVAGLEQTAKLIADDGQADDLLGNGVAISGDLVAVGAPGRDETGRANLGAVYVFNKPNAGWAGTISQDSRLYPGDDANGYGFGTAVATNGHVIASGVIFPSGNKVYLFGKPETDWSTISGVTESTGTLEVTETTVSLGYSTAITGDTLVCGTLQNEVFIFTNLGHFPFPWNMFLPAIIKK